MATISTSLTSVTNERMAMTENNSKEEYFYNKVKKIGCECESEQEQTLNLRQLGKELDSLEEKAKLQQE